MTLNRWLIFSGHYLRSWPYPLRYVNVCWTISSWWLMMSNFLISRDPKSPTFLTALSIVDSHRLSCDRRILSMCHALISLFFGVNIAPLKWRDWILHIQGVILVPLNLNLYHYIGPAKLSYYYWPWSLRIADNVLHVVFRSILSLFRSARNGWHVIRPYLLNRRFGTFSVPI